LPELLAPQLGQHQLQALDFEPPNLGLALRKDQGFSLREDHCMRTGQVLRKWIRRCCHSTNGAYLQLKIMLKQSSSIKTHSFIRRLRTPSFLWMSPIDAGEQIRHLSDADGHDAIGHQWPNEPAALQSFRK